MSKHIITVIFVLFSLLNIPLKGYTFSNKDIHLLTMQDGLSDNHVLSIFKDLDGFMWFGTNNGLNRFDGSSIDVFSMDLNTNMIVSQIANISEHYLGLIINGKLYGFNRQTEEFIHIKVNGESIELNQFICDENGTIYIINDNYLDIYEFHEEISKEIGSNHSIKHQQTKKNIYNKGNYISKINLSEDKKELLFISDDCELAIYNIKENKIDQRVQLHRANNQYNINAIIDYVGIIWISTVADGIITYDRNTHSINSLTYIEDKGKIKLSHTDV